MITVKPGAFFKCSGPALMLLSCLFPQFFPPFARIYTTFIIHVAVLSLAAVCVYYRGQLDGEQVANPPEANVVFVILGCINNTDLL